MRYKLISSQRVNPEFLDLHQHETQVATMRMTSVNQTGIPQSY